MRRFRDCALLVSLALLFVSVPVRAAPKLAQVVVLESRTPAELKPDERARLGDALWAALDRLGIHRVADSDREAVLSGEEGLRACLDRDECQEKLGRVLEATHVIGVLLLRTAPASYQLDLRLFDVDVGQMGATATWSCSECKVEDVARQLDSLVEQAVERDRDRPRATVVVKSSPPNAEVKLDGRQVGYTELEHRVFAGSHDLVVSRVGLAPERMRLELAGDQRLVVSLALAPRAEPVAAVKQGRAELAAAQKEPTEVPGSRAWRGVGLGLGIPLLLGGGVLGFLGGNDLYLNGRCVEAAPVCQHVYDTLLPGALLLGGGVVAAAIGVGLIVKGVRAGRPHLEYALVPALLPGGAGAGLWTSF